MTPRAASLLLIVPPLVFVAALASSVVDPHALYDFPLDDGWIHRVYADALAHGRGFAYNDGVQEAGSTSPLWAILTAPAHWLDVLGERTVVVFVKLIGALLGLVTVCTAQRLVRRWSGSELAACIAATLLALEPRLLFCSLSGMETTLLLALWSSSLLMFLSERDVTSIGLFALMPVTRPEALVVFPLILLPWVRLWRRERSGVARLMVGLVPFVPMAIWMLFCYSVSGHPLPNTFYLKSRGFHLGGDELLLAWQSLGDHALAPWWSFVVFFTAFVVLTLTTARLRPLPSLVLFVAAPVVYLLAVVGSRDVSLSGYYWTRWLDPATILLMVPVVAGCGVLAASALAALAGRSGSAISIPRAGITAVCVVTAIPFWADSWLDRRTHLAMDSRAIHLINVQTGLWVDRHTPREAVIAVNDAGAIRYFGRRTTIDLVGLNNADIAFARMSLQAALAKADWLAVFPTWFAGPPLTALVEERFVLRESVQIPLEEYTVCPCPGQNQTLIYQSRADPGGLGGPESAQPG